MKPKYDFDRDLDRNPSHKMTGREKSIARQHNHTTALKLGKLRKATRKQYGGLDEQLD